MRLPRPPILRPTGLLLGTLVCAVVAGCGDPGVDVVTSPEAGAASRAGAATDAGTPATPAGTEIPEDFPLSAGMGGPGDLIPTSRTGTGLRGLELCDSQPLRDLGARDRMVADNSGGESANTRELVLLGSADEAERVALEITDLAEHCDTPDMSRGTETRTEVRASPFGPSPAVTLVQTYAFDGTPGTGATVLHVVPAGAALLVTSTYGQWPLGDVEEAVTATVRPLRETVRALSDLDDQAPSGSATAAASASSSAAEEDEEEPTPVPAGFPLGTGLPDDDADTTVAAPSRDVEGVGLVDMCGQQAWPPRVSGTRRLAARADGPEWQEVRELVVAPSAEDAVGVMGEVRRAQQTCHRDGTRVWSALDRETGWETVTVGLTWTDGLGSTVHQFTRVGEAILLVSTYGEGSLASLDRRADEVTETTGTIVPAMCVFTKTGC